MMKTGLVLQLPGAELGAETQVAWYLFGGGVLHRRGETALVDLRAELPAQIVGETLVLVPGELVLLTSVRIPARQLRQVKQALPYMVEELIADNIEEVHLALPPLASEQLGAAIPVAVVRHSLLINWLDQLYQHGFSPDRLSPDTLALPWRNQARAFFFSGERLLYRDGLSSGLALSRQQLPQLLALLAVQGAPTVPGTISVDAGSEQGELLPQLAGEVEQQLGAEVASRGYGESGAEVLATAAARNADEMINLLQGGYRVRRDREENQDWRRVATVAGIGLLLYMALAGGSAAWFSWRAGEMEQRGVALYRELFPDERRVISPRKQMAAHLSGGSDSSLLPLLAQASSELAASQLQELRYRRDNNQLQVQLQAPSLAELDRIKQRLAATGLTVAIDSAAEQGGGTVGRITIGGVR